MNQKFYETIGSMSAEKADKLLALFDNDPKTKTLVLNYFNGIENPPAVLPVLVQALIYLRNMQSQIE